MQKLEPFLHQFCKVPKLQNQLNSLKLLYSPIIYVANNLTESFMEKEAIKSVNLVSSVINKIEGLDEINYQVELVFNTKVTW
jgi:hypothetical protein